MKYMSMTDISDTMLAGKQQNIFSATNGDYMFEVVLSIGLELLRQSNR